MSRIWPFALAMLGAALAAAAEPTLEERIDAQLQPYLDVGHLSGTVLVAAGEDVLYERSFGLANREHGVANAPDTRFCVGSVNKPMTLVILARLIELEKLSLGDSLSKYLPEFPRAGDITVGFLAGHGAGIPTAKVIQERADMWAFLVQSLGMTLPENYQP